MSWSRRQEGPSRPAIFRRSYHAPGLELAGCRSRQECVESSREAGHGHGRRPPHAAHEQSASPREVGILKKWIDQGAKYDEHWSLVKPVRQPLPAVKNRKWPRNASTTSSWRVWKRKGWRLRRRPTGPLCCARVSLDLTGLPPTIKELNDFLADTRTDAYEHAVDEAAGVAALRRTPGPLLAGPCPLRRYQRLRGRQPPYHLALPRLGHQGL